jgi:surface antigen
MFIKLNGLCIFKKKNAIFSLAFIGLLSSLLQFNNAYADPPPWARANGYRDNQYRERDDEGDNDRGYRKEHHHEHEDESDDEDEDYSPEPEIADTPYVAPYGIEQGTCDRERLGQVLGGIAGAAIGSTVKQGGGNSNSAAIIGGTIIGIIVGGNIGRSMDRVDQGCVGQILEHDPDGSQVAWFDREGNTQYQVTPEKPFKDRSGRYCRKYLTNAVAEGVNRRTYNTACRESDGTWKRIR